jgi:two-component sensor histidine kinase
MKHYKFCIIIICFFSYSIYAVSPLSKKLDLIFDQGKILYEEQRYAEATELFNQLIEVGKAQKETHLLANIYYNLGLFYDNKRQHHKSLDFLFSAITLINNQRTKVGGSRIHSTKKNLPPFTPQESKIICNLYNRIGGVYFNQEDYRKAEKYWKIAYSIAEEYQQIKPLSKILNNLGEIKRLSGDFQAALPFYKEALSIKNSIQDSLGMNMILSNIGSTYLKLGKKDSAKLFYDQSYKMAQILQHPKLTLICYMDYMLYYKAINKADLAIKWGRETLDIVENYGDLNILLTNYKELAAIYEQQNILDSCLFFQKKWIELSKVINHRKTEKAASEIEVKFLISEKETELLHLKDKSRIEQQNNQFKDYFQSAFILGLFGILALTLVMLRLRNKKNKKLASSLLQINQQNREKDFLLKEIHHRVKNNLQVITSLLSLQSYNIDDPTTKALFSQSQHRINSMAMIHEMLYQSNDFSKINYKNYLDQLLDKLVSSFKGNKHQVQLSVEVPDIFLNIDTAIPLGLLINEIITNALKYGLSDDEAGILSVKMQALEAPNFLLEIGDNGIGYSTDFKSKKHSSLGLRLIQQLTVQLNGTIEKIPTKTGTHYKLQFQEIETFL